MAKLSKNLQKSYKDISKEELYLIEDAIKLLKKASYEKFDPSFEVSFNLNLDTKQADQQLRGSIVLPHGTGKISKVLVIAEPDDQAKAKSAGADEVGSIVNLDELIKSNKLNFDFIVTTPKLMPSLAKFGKALGPKGLMPNPKLGTVTTDIEKAVENIKKGQLEYRTNAQGLVNLSIGKKSFEDSKLIDNFNSIYSLIKSKKPSSAKGEYVINISISTTMGPGLRIEK